MNRCPGFEEPTRNVSASSASRQTTLGTLESALTHENTSQEAEIRHTRGFFGL